MSTQNTDFFFILHSNKQFSIPRLNDKTSRRVIPPLSTGESGLPDFAGWPEVGIRPEKNGFNIIQTVWIESDGDDDGATGRMVMVGNHYVLYEFRACHSLGRESGEPFSLADHIYTARTRLHGSGCGVGWVVQSVYSWSPPFLGGSVGWRKVDIPRDVILHCGSICLLGINKFVRLFRATGKLEDEHSFGGVAY